MRFGWNGLEACQWVFSVNGYNEMVHGPCAHPWEDRAEIWWLERGYICAKFGDRRSNLKTVHYMMKS